MVEPEDVIRTAWEQLIAALCEHMGIDAVQIIFTSHEGDATTLYAMGQGHATIRRAIVAEWLDNVTQEPGEEASDVS